MWRENKRGTFPCQACKDKSVILDKHWLLYSSRKRWHPCGFDSLSWNPTMNDFTDAFHLAKVVRRKKKNPFSEGDKCLTYCCCWSGTTQMHQGMWQQNRSRMPAAVCEAWIKDVCLLRYASWRRPNRWVLNCNLQSATDANRFISSVKQVFFFVLDVIKVHSELSRRKKKKKVVLMRNVGKYKKKIKQPPYVGNNNRSGELYWAWQASCSMQGPWQGSCIL